MKILLTYILLFAPLKVSLADMQYAGPIKFKGAISGEKFINEKYSIGYFNETYTIKHLDMSDVITFKSPNHQIRDVVFSKNKKSVAIATVSKQKESSMGLTSIDSRGEKKTCFYDAYKMSETLSWIVALGSVSDGGMYVLAKCASVSRVSAQVKRVTHKWAILKITDSSLEVISDSDAINEWAQYAAK